MDGQSDGPKSTIFVFDLDFTFELIAEWSVLILIWCVLPFKPWIYST